uniref:Ig-like domain-containing protein n=1 Tax=Varanus komodoensis TaxID=61221 RepID=A0A8D2ISR3_VARKO
MAWPLFYLAVLSSCAGVRSQLAVIQPASLSVSLGQTVQIPCSRSSGGSWANLNWQRQKPGQAPQVVLYGSSTRGPGIPDRFTGTASGTTNYLNIANAQAEDEADYYCLSWEKKSNTIHSDIFRWGGQSKIFTKTSLFLPSMRDLESVEGSGRPQAAQRVRQGSLLLIPFSWPQGEVPFCRSGEKSFLPSSNGQRKIKKGLFQPFIPSVGNTERALLGIT